MSASQAHGAVLTWTEDNLGSSFLRSDGAVVRWRMGQGLVLDWIAFEPDPSNKYLIRYSKSGKGFYRRWGSAQAAMRAVDREFPVALDKSKLPK